MNVRVWLTSGKFESQISIPLNYTEPERQQFVEAWLLLMSSAVRLGVKL